MEEILTDDPGVAESEAADVEALIEAMRTYFDHLKDVEVSL